MLSRKKRLLDEQNKLKEEEENIRTNAPKKKKLDVDDLEKNGKACLLEKKIQNWSPFQSRETKKEAIEVLKDNNNLI